MINRDGGDGGGFAPTARPRGGTSSGSKKINGAVVDSGIAHILYIGFLLVILWAVLEMLLIGYSFSFRGLGEAGITFAGLARPEIHIGFLGYTLSPKYLVLIILSAVEWILAPFEIKASFPYFAHRTHYTIGSKRLPLQRWHLIAWLIVFLVDVGTSYSGVRDWLQKDGVIPLFGGIHLPREGAAQAVFNFVISSFIALGAEPIIKKALRSAGDVTGWW